MQVVRTDACPNCGSELTGAYCASCGQKRAHTDLTLRELLDEATHELVHWDGKIPETLKALFLQPGILTIDFLKGRRARWLMPLRVYLICSVAYFISVPVVESITGRKFRENLRFEATNADGTRITTITPEVRRQLEEGLPGRILGVDRLEHAIKAPPDELSHVYRTSLPKAMFVLLPLFAVFTNVAWRRKQLRYPAHLYTALHLHAAWFGAFAIAMIATMVFRSDKADFAIGVLVVSYVLWHTLTALRRVFGESWVKTIVKLSAVALVYLPGVLIVSLLMMFVWLMTL